MNYYIADTHFGHENIIRFSKRPFANATEMDKALIDNWNSRVTDDDDVYILGDFAYRSKNPMWYAKMLKGKKHLIVGNHDSKLINHPDLEKYFVEVTDIKTISDHGTKIVCCHYPMVEWDGYYRDVMHFYGHIHNNSSNATNKYMQSVKNAYNVGADLINFTPRTLTEIIRGDFQ